MQKNDLVGASSPSSKRVSKKVYAGIDIGGTKTAVVLSREPPELLVRFAFPTRQTEGPKIAIDCIVASLHKALSSQGLVPADLAGIGISCGGPLDSLLGIIQSPPNLSTWKDVPICNILKEAFGAPCSLENDANAGALAEIRFGAGRGLKNLAFLTMGTGIGAGLIVNGHLLRGASSSAGEIGHIRLTRFGPRGYGKVGSVEGWASGGGMSRVAKSYIEAALARGEHTSFVKGPKEPTAREVAEAAKSGDAVAKAVVRKVGEKLGETMSILIDLLNPECIVVAGLALRFGEDLLQPAREVVRRETLRASAEVCRIVQHLWESR